MALAVSTVRYALREVALKDKPTALLEVSPKATVPVLVLPEGQVIDQSLDIMRWALGQHDPRHWLVKDESLRAMTMSLIEVNDGPFKYHLDRMKYPNRYVDGQNQDHRAEAVSWLVQLEDRLREHAFLLGAVETLVDVAVFPFIRQFAHADPLGFAALPMPALQRWLSGWESSILFETVMAKYPIWRPDNEEIHVRGAA